MALIPRKHKGRYRRAVLLRVAWSKMRRRPGVLEPQGEFRRLFEFSVMTVSLVTSFLGRLLR